MALLALLGYGSFLLVALVVGVRLLLLWRWTRETPELAIGVTLSAGSLSFALAIAAFSVPELPPAAAASIEMVSGFLAHLASAALALAMRHIFRPDERWARALQLSLTVALVGSFLLRLLDPLAFPPPTFVFWPYTLLGAGIYAWSVVETLLCWRATVRRARLELAEPALARRFLLWAIAGAAAFGIYVLAMIERVLEPGVFSPVMIIGMSLLGLAAAVGLSFAFFPHDHRGLSVLRGGRADA